MESSPPSLIMVPVSTPFLQLASGVRDAAISHAAVVSGTLRKLAITSPGLSFCTYTHAVLKT
eukprot:4356006-Amphidinium_carterae.1